MRTRFSILNYILRNKYFIFLSLFIYILLIPYIVFGWAFYAHIRIAENASDNLPEPMQQFYQNNRQYIGQHSIDPDLWRRADPDEAPRHYINIDKYGNFPFDILPRSWCAATAKYSIATVIEHGIIPWRIDEYTRRLTQAFRENRWNDVLLDSAALSHYVADAHVPLHVTANYDGQLTGNRGIHSRFESRMIELYKNDIKDKIISAEYIPNAINFSFDFILDSFIYVQTIIYADTIASRLDPQYGNQYYAKLWELTGPIAEQRMQQSAYATASLWYSAWRDAGKPSLPTDFIKK